MYSAIGVGKGHIAACYRTSVSLVVADFIRPERHSRLPHQNIARGKQTSVFVIYRDAVRLETDVFLCREAGRGRDQANHNQRKNTQ